MEETIRSRTVFEGRLVRVRVDDVRLPSGRESTREVIEHPGAVAVVPVTAEGDVLLIRQYQYVAGKVLLELPAGLRESGETPAETARRELIEEIGYEPGRLSELATFFSSPGFANEQVTLFRADDCRPVAHEHDQDEPIEIRKVPLNEIPALLTPGAQVVENAHSLIGLLWLLRKATP